MPAIIFSWGPLHFSLFGLFLSLGFLIASEIFFQKSREEFANEDEVITFLLTTTLGALAGGRLIFIFHHHFPRLSDYFLVWRHGGLSLWGGIFFFLLSAYLTSKKMKIDPWRLSDSFLVPFFVMVEAFLLPSFLVNPAAKTAFLPILTFIAFLVGLWLSRHYRSLSWYPSGKIGLALLTFLFLLFSGSLLGLVFIPSYHLYWSEIIINLTNMLAIVMIGYQRSGRTKKIHLFSKFFKK